MTDSPAPLRLYLVDDQILVRAALRSMLAQQDGCLVVGDVGDSRRAIEEIRELRPDVVLLDVAMPGLSGIDAIPLLREASPSSRIVMLTHHEGGRVVEQALRAGAHGYLSKDSDPGELRIALRAVVDGHVYLTPRVAEVLLWLAQGKTNAAIGAILGISESTVKKHVLAIFEKLGVETRGAAALRALELLSGAGGRTRG